MKPAREDLNIFAAHALKQRIWITGMFLGSAILTVTLVIALWFIAPTTATAADAVVYSVHRGVDMGNPGEIPSKDYYINMGVQQGVRKGSVLEVSRKLATYDLLSEKLYKEVVFPIATLKVIHAESGVAIARLDKMISPDQAPSFSPRAIMVGDLVTSSR
ncbi:MAG: hypothetical protein ACK5QT_08140 [Oligoflexia bacterium]